VGGVETYLEALLPALARRHELAFWSASDTLTDRGPILVPADVQVIAHGHSASDHVNRLRAWEPDLLFAHGLDDPALEKDLLGIAPVVQVQHTYHGTCISSSKTMSWPAVRACERSFGPACLALYFPRRCGGLNPLTMAHMYRLQSLRLANLKRAAAVVTLSAHMADELIRNGVPADRIHVVPPFAPDTGTAVREARRNDGPCRLLFLGRLEPLKGVAELLEALPRVVERLSRPVLLTVAGDGAERRTLEMLASTVQQGDHRIGVRFAGWQNDAARSTLLSEADAIVVPSVWPEPFGLVGIEAATAGVPAIAFATGGIPEWLRDGENGCLVPTAGDRTKALADGIVRCVGSAETLSRLSTGARASSRQWTLSRHIQSLELVFDALGASPAPSLTARAPSQYA
jgi:glycosyltransferase involved in cell wall biosynthesis